VNGFVTYVAVSSFDVAHHRIQAGEHVLVSRKDRAFTIHHPDGSVPSGRDSEFFPVIEQALARGYLVPVPSTPAKPAKPATYVPYIVHKGFTIGNYTTAPGEIIGVDAKYREVRLGKSGHNTVLGGEAHYVVIEQAIRLGHITPAKPPPAKPAMPATAEEYEAKMHVVVGSHRIEMGDRLFIDLPDQSFYLTHPPDDGKRQSGQVFTNIERAIRRGWLVPVVTTPAPPKPTPPTPAKPGMSINDVSALLDNLIPHWTCEITVNPDGNTTLTFVCEWNDYTLTVHVLHPTVAPPPFRVTLDHRDAYGDRPTRTIHEDKGDDLTALVNEAVAKTPYAPAKPDLPKPYDPTGASDKARKVFGALIAKPELAQEVMDLLIEHYAKQARAKRGKRLKQANAPLAAEWTGSTDSAFLRNDSKTGQILASITVKEYTNPTRAAAGIQIYDAAGEPWRENIIEDTVAGAFTEAREAADECLKNQGWSLLNPAAHPWEENNSVQWVRMGGPGTPIATVTDIRDGEVEWEATRFDIILSGTSKTVAIAKTKATRALKELGWEVPK